MSTRYVYIVFQNKVTWGVPYSYIQAVLSTKKKAEKYIKKLPISYKYDNFSIRQYPIGYAVGSGMLDYKEII